MMEYVQHAHHLVKIVPVFQFALVAFQGLDKLPIVNVLIITLMTMEHALHAHRLVLIAIAKQLAIAV